jgi:hypothetical protein
MSWDNHTISVLLPFGVAALLVGSAIAGSRLQPSRKRQVESFFLFPAFVLLAVSLMINAAVWEHDWGQFALFALVAGIAVWRLLAHRRAARG